MFLCICPCSLRVVMPLRIFMPVCFVLFCFFKSPFPYAAHQVVFSCVVSVPPVMAMAFLRSLVILGSWTLLKSEARRGQLEVVILSMALTAASLAVRWSSWIDELRKLLCQNLSVFPIVLARFHREDSPTSNLEEEGLAARGKRNLGNSASIMPHSTPCETSTFNCA